MDKMCVIPWIHLNIEPDKKVLPCCITSHHRHTISPPNPVVGNVSKQSLEDIWNNNKMKSLRKQFMKGEEPSICNRCFDDERGGVISNRQYSNYFFSKMLKKIPEITLEDGTCTEFKLRYWDFRFSNLCNMKCRSCGPIYSSLWKEDARKLGNMDFLGPLGANKKYTEKFDKQWEKFKKTSHLMAKDNKDKVVKIDLVDNKKTFDFIDEHIDYVEKIYFAGGEPLLMDEHWYIIEKLHRMKKFDIKIFYNTNMSTLKSKNKHIIDYWKDFQDIDIAASIDEIDKRAEIVRSGTNWKRVEDNLIEVSKLKNINLGLEITVSAMNVFRLPEILQRCIDIGVIHGERKKGIPPYQNFHLNHLFNPDVYHVSILTDSRRKQALKHLNNFIIDKMIKHKINLKPMFNQVIQELNKPQNSNARKRFFKISERLDFIRKEKITDIIPEILT